MSLRAALQAATARLAKAGIEQPGLDARLLLQHISGHSHESLLLADDSALPPAQAAAFEALLLRRVAREPVSHLLGVREFWGRPFHVTPDVLTPRPDSETLIEAVLARVSDRATPASILDLGTGTGCLLLTLLAELPGARGLGVDASEAALAVAARNADALKLAPRATFLQGDWCTNLPPKKYEIVVANPPYIASNAIHALMLEVAEYEPPLALDGGDDGLMCYRKIAAGLPPHLSPRAIVAMEVGAGQHNAVAGIFSDAGLRLDAMVPDLAGILRCVVFSYQ